MKKKLLDLSGKIETLDIEVFKSITKIADRLLISYFIVGAAARDLIFGAFDINAGRATKDLDIGLQAENWDHFSKLKTNLLDTKDFVETAQQQRLDFQGLLKIDIVPFGPIAGPDKSISWPDDQSTTMSTIGFEDAFNDAFTGILSDDPDFNIKIASICGLTIMKMIAWGEKYPEREKDAIDLDFMMRNYISAGNDERFYEEGTDIINENTFDYEIASAWFLGRDAGNISNSRTKAVIQKILTEQTGSQERYRLVEDMIRSFKFGGGKFENALKLLESFKKGYTNPSDK